MSELDELRIADRKHIGLAEMLKGGVIMDVTTAEQAKIAEDAGATSVMALERVPASSAIFACSAVVTSMKIGRAHV